MIKKELKILGITSQNLGSSTGQKWFSGGEVFESLSPVDGKLIAKVSGSSQKDYETVIGDAQNAFKAWRLIPAPKRGDIIRQLGDKLRELKPTLGKLVSYEMGKSYQEGMGEVQEMIDICDFALGLSRQLYGNTIHSERPGHRMYDQYHPLGVVGIITAFNFPVAVWAWNTAIALVCGNTVVWKPSEKTPLCAIACQKLLAEILHDNGLPEGISNLVMGDKEVGEWLASDNRISLVSATGSTRMG
ncbi:MAG: aldehyde dehydrogenase family protein, partial [Sphingobacterium sp.]